MIEPYSDRPDTAGSLLVNASTLTSLTRSWSSKGYQVNIHAIGGSYYFLLFAPGFPCCHPYQEHSQSIYMPHHRASCSA